MTQSHFTAISWGVQLKNYILCVWYCFLSQLKNALKRLCCPMEVNLAEDFRCSWPFNFPSKVHSAAGHLEVKWPQSFVPFIWVSLVKWIYLLQVWDFWRKSNNFAAMHGKLTIHVSMNKSVMLVSYAIDAIFVQNYFDLEGTDLVYRR